MLIITNTLQLIKKQAYLIIMGAKIQIKNDSVKNLGGFFLSIDHFRHDEMSEIIGKTLVHRKMYDKYSYFDNFLSLAAIYLTGGSCIEDANRLSPAFTETYKRHRFCSAYTILRMIKSI